MRRLAAIAIALALVGCKRHHHGARGAIAIDWIAIPEGTFAMGSARGDEDERPVHDEHVAAFAIGRTEVTAAQYEACVAAKACTPTPEKNYCNEHVAKNGEHPINCVTWDQARAFCAWVGARLPSEVEWEYAARGTNGRKYPWGDEKPGARLLCWDGVDSDLGLGKRRGTCVVGAHPEGASAFGAQDMAGNVWEWTADFYSPSYGAAPDEQVRVARGGTWLGYDAHDVRATLRFRFFPAAQNYGVGFRCAR